MVLGLRMGIQNPILNRVFSLGSHWAETYNRDPDDLGSRLLSPNPSSTFGELGLGRPGDVSSIIGVCDESRFFFSAVIKVMHSTYIKDMNLGQGYMPEFARFSSFMLLTGRVNYLAMDWQHLEAVWTRRALWTQRASLNERR
ncbi:hypothetical protein H0E87_017012 [Populus deltoides]|uniref:Uncharacterized protein n=1 Tax=Populus deltoides TaxID=3696 RepID=A0A8T2XYL1_POPDE|nr:hypothetical protein H0E87_017012 [Populus deltoides]